MINIAICDDNKNDTQTLTNLLEKLNKERPNIKINVHNYTSTSTIMDEIEKGKTYDIYLIEITISQNKGIDLIKFLRSIENESTIIINTTSKEHALEAYNLNVSQYLLKPIKEEKFTQIINKEIEKKHKKNKKEITINSKQGIKKIPYHKIIFIDTKNHIAFLHLTDGKTIESKTLRKSFNEFTNEIEKDKRFLRPHYSFLINIDYVEKMNPKEFEMLGGKKVPISKSKLAKAKEKYINYK